MTQLPGCNQSKILTDSQIKYEADKPMDDIKDWIAKYKGHSADEFFELFPRPFLLVAGLEKRRKRTTNATNATNANDSAGEGTLILGKKSKQTKAIETSKLIKLKKVQPKKSGFVPQYSQVRVIQKQKAYYPEKITIGRTSTNDIQFDHQMISRFHAYFRYKESENAYYFADAGSSNGTWVNQKKLDSNTSIVLNEHDRISLSQAIELKFIHSFAFHSYMLFCRKYIEES